tara:strand:- start:931 stop:1113 length:183 start_codon:yes stop_codon:yes gene_type:complete
MLDKFLKLMRSKAFFITLLLMNAFVFIIGLALNNLDLLFISGCSYATVLISMYLNREDEE